LMAVAFALVVSLAFLRPARAETAPTRPPALLAMDSAANLEVRRVQLQAYVDRVAGPHAAPAFDARALCAEFDVFDMLRKPEELWAQVSRVPRQNLVESLFDMVRSCGYSEGASRRSGYLLDFLYWNRLADTTGYEVADVLLLRDVLYEIF